MSKVSQSSPKNLNVLVCRFSAMGDVILIYPVLKAVLLAYPEVQITLLTRASYAVFFEDLPRLKIHAVDFKKDYKGFFGLYKLYRTLKSNQFDYFLDLHQSLRSRVLQIFFKSSGLKCFTYQKSRADKKKMTRPEHKKRQALTHTTERYKVVFQRAGLDIDLKKPHFFDLENRDRAILDSFLDKHTLPKKNNAQKWIGIAPFAQHENKIWGISKIKELISELTLKGKNIHIFLFGGGASEVEQLENIAQSNPMQLFCVAGQLPLSAEMQLIQDLDVMIAMDSSNMHLASISGIPVISIWGATHPDIGFAPLYQPKSNFVQVSVEELPCRPCSVYGNKPCLRGDKACMERISAHFVAEKVKEILE